MTTAAANPTTIRELDAASLRRALDAGEADLVDVREPDERAREWIEGSRPAPLSALQPADLRAAPGRRLVLHCRSGRRSLDAANRLLAAGARDVAHLTGGIEAWKAAGLPVRTARAPLPIMRQVQIAAGSAVLLGTIAGLLASPWFFAVPIFFGAGLTFAGLSGTCGLAAVLARMPWNRPRAAGPERVSAPASAP